MDTVTVMQVLAALSIKACLFPFKPSRMAFKHFLYLTAVFICYCLIFPAYVHVLPATQNVFKYTQTHREIKVLADTSYCFIVYALAIVNNTLLTSSCTLHSRKFLR